MSLILLEALLAAIVLVLIVWWTMFAGRTGGELDGEAHRPPAAPDDAPEGVTEDAPEGAAADKRPPGG